MMPGGYVPGGSATLEDIITGYGKQKADIAQTQASTRGTDQQTAVNAQIEQAHQLQNEATQRALRDQQIATEALGGVKRTNADGTPRAPREMIGEVSSAMRKGGATLGATFGLEKQLMESIEGYNKMDEGTRKLHDENYAKVGSLLGAIQEAPPEQQAALWQQAFPELNRLEPGTFSQEFPGADQLKGQTGLHGGLGAILVHQKTQAELDKDKAQAALDTAKTPGEKAESDKKVLITQAMQEALKDPTKGAAAIDAILPASIDAEGNTAYKAAYNAAMQSGGPEAAQKIVEAVAAHAGRHADTVNPAIAAAKTKQAVAEQTALAPGKLAGEVASERATSPIKLANAIATAKALRQGDNPAVAGVPPAVVAQVQNDAIKLDHEYIQAKGAAEAMGHFIDLAESGNTVAGSNVPVMGAETASALNGIKRISPAQVAGNEAAGSMLQRIQGKIEKLAVGQPIPKAVLEDMREFQQSLGDAAYSKYTTGLSSLNQRTGAKFGDTVGAPKLAKSSGLPQGSGKVLDEATGKKFYDAAGGDPAKARKLATDAGWKIQ